MANSRKDSPQILSYAHLYLYFKKFLSSQITPFTTKRVFLLAIYDFLIGRINFATLVFIASELGFQLNNFFDLSDQDDYLAQLLLELDELEEEKLIIENDQEVLELKERLIAFYQSSLPEEYYLRQEVIHQFQREIARGKSILALKKLFSSLATGKEFSLGEMVAVAISIADSCQINQLAVKNKEEKYFLSRLETIVGLIADWFLETKENYSFFLKTLIQLAAFPEKSRRILKEVISSYFDHQISRPLMARIIADINNWAAFVQEKKILELTKPLKEALARGSDEALLKDDLEKCLKAL